MLHVSPSPSTPDASDSTRSLSFGGTVVRSTSWHMRPALVAVGCFAAFSVACQDKNLTEANVVVPVVSTNRFVQKNLVADIAGTGAVTIDPNLINPWGIAFGASGALWVSNNGTGTATVYNADGTSLGITVAIPGAGGAAHDSPTGVVFNT